jgi:hypothetical protein
LCGAANALSRSSTYTKAMPERTATVATQTSELAGDHAGYNSLNDLLRAADAVFSGSKL